MENIPATRDALTKNFSVQSPSILPENEISIYRGNVISDESIVRYSVMIRQAFPSLPSEFYGVLLEMVKEEGFTDERFRDSVHSVIKTCVYPTPTIAQFISFDRRFKVLRYEDLLKKADEFGQEILKNYKPVKLPDRKKLVWVHQDDVLKNNLEVFTPENTKL